MYGINFMLTADIVFFFTVGYIFYVGGAIIFTHDLCSRVQLTNTLEIIRKSTSL
jgi:hypothetical protein